MNRRVFLVAVSMLLRNITRHQTIILFDNTANNVIPISDNALSILNVQLFPSSWNTYDSYAEILLKHGKKQDAIKMYQKSVELNPNNENGKMILEQILK